MTVTVFSSSFYCRGCGFCPFSRYFRPCSVQIVCFSRRVSVLVQRSVAVYLAMFDWSDTEVTNIVWADDDASDDHIVPFSKEGDENQRGISGESLKKVWDKEDDKSSSSQRVLSGKTDGPGLNKLGSYTQDEVHKGNCVTAISLWPDLSLSDVSRTDQDSFDTELSNNLTEITKLDSSKDVAPQVNKASEAFQNEDADREQGDFLDYGWANIGSFDDLDRIFSNEDSIFGNANLGNEDELWSSSKTITGSPEKFFPPSLDSSSPELGAFKGSSNHYENNLAFLGKTSSLNTQLGTKSLTTSSLNDNLTGKVLVPSRKSSRRRRKNYEKQGWSDYHARWTNSGNQFHQLDGQLRPSILTRQTPISVPSQYQPFTYPLMSPNQNQYGSKTVLPHTYLQEDDDRKGILPYEASPTNLDRKTSDALPQPLRMTPQEKIEKLRRRQQMQALLAIQKQQQQYSHHGSLDEHPKIQPEVNNTCFDPKSSEQDDSDILSVVVDDCCSIEVAILHQIQNKIDKLDVNTRLCIRDSLFRLAQSAKLRHYSNDTSCSNGSSKADPLAKEESRHNRLSQVPDTETATNPIDRAVAHLLFHRSLESSPSLGKLPRTPESPGSSTLRLERKRKAQTLYHSSGSRSSLLSLEGATSQNASNVESAKVEACLEAEPQTQLSYDEI